MYVRVVLLMVCCALAVGCGATASAPSAPTASAAFSQADLVVGTGATATAGSKVTVSYGGWLYDAQQSNGKGRQFDSQTITFTVGAGQVIKGWDQGVVGMKVGGQRRLVIPPDLAYGAAGVAGAIPGNATLLFDITLLGVS
jgi:FKBP-type peptidyl-prolyl cis-trans isomerase